MTVFLYCIINVSKFELKKFITKKPCSQVLPMCNQVQHVQAPAAILNTFSRASCAVGRQNSLL